MNEVIRNELKNWCETLNIDDLNEYDISVINIILNHYDELIEAGGTAGGKRANKFVEYVNEKEGVCDKELETLTFGEKKDSKRIKRLKKLSVESFRGFAVSRDFNLNKKYVFLYGPNGSGKSSFSEALEYGLLNIIQEADANKIKLSVYIKNTSTKKGKAPNIICIYDDDTEGRVSADYDLYRFAFVEKNRISDFSHISVLNSKNQSERISALFGLSEFNDFVQGFTTNFDEKYLQVKSLTEDAFKERKAVRVAKESQKSKFEEELKNIQDLCQKIIKKIEKPEITKLDVALDYLQNPKTGILSLKIAERDKNYKELLSGEKINELKYIVKEIREEFTKLTDYRNSLSNKAIQVNYRTLYEAIVNLQEKDTCPACGTPIKDAIRNPYTYAKEQLKSFSELETIQRNISDCSKNIKVYFQKVIAFVEKNTQLIQLLHIEVNDMVFLDTDEIRTMSEKMQKWRTLCDKINKIDDTLALNEINIYNATAQRNNESYDEQVKNISELNNQLLTFKTQINEKEQQVKALEKEIKEFDEQSVEISNKIQKEKSLCNFNQGIITAYNKVISSIISYNNELPNKISKNLEEKIINYYNTINQDDADFEKIKEIILPNANFDKLMLTFRDGSSAEALQVLSEGHIKILGLSILLAKAIHDNLNFIVFDDIVNAIDDDHRNGIADLLINHEDFRNVQIILSTHGEQFIFKLQDKLGKKRYNRDAITYKFIPADSLEERGVVAEYSDAKAPLDAAEKKYEENEIKDSASKCRQAMECISYNLWNVIAKTPNGMISIGMRSPKSIPDLSSIVDGLIKKTKGITGMDDINSELVCLKEESNWRILNKGTHYEDEQKEFDRHDVKSVREHLNTLDNLIRNVKIEEKVVQKLE